MTSIFYDTAKVEVSKRFDYWKNATHSAYLPLETSRGNDMEFFGRILLVDLGGVSVSRISSGAQKVQRSRKSILSEEAASLIFLYQVSGTCQIFQHGQHIRLKRGQIAFINADQPYELRFAGTFDQYVLQVPKAMIRSKHKWMGEDIGLRGVQSDEFSAQTKYIFESLLRLYFNSSEEARPGKLVALLKQLTALFQEASSSSADGLSVKQFEYLDRAKRFMLSNLKNDTLNVDGIAAECGVTSRYMRSLFASENNKMTHWIMHQRLECARMDLERQAGRSSFVSAVAYRWGFPDHSNFCRKFKAAYGVSPSQWQKNEFNASFLSDAGQTVSNTPSPNE